jgi:hypothetical protein
MCLFCDKTFLISSKNCWRHHLSVSITAQSSWRMCCDLRHGQNPAKGLGYVNVSMKLGRLRLENNWTNCIFVLELYFKLAVFYHFATVMIAKLSRSTIFPRLFLFTINYVLPTYLRRTWDGLIAIKNQRFKRCNCLENTWSSFECLNGNFLSYTAFLKTDRTHKMCTNRIFQFRVPKLHIFQDFVIVDSRKNARGRVHWSIYTLLYKRPDKIIYWTAKV